MGQHCVRLLVYTSSISAVRLDWSTTVQNSRIESQMFSVSCAMFVEVCMCSLVEISLCLTLRNAVECVRLTDLNYVDLLYQTKRTRNVSMIV